MAKLNLLLSGLTLSALVVTASATPIVANGSFEDPDTNGAPHIAIYHAGDNMPGWHVDYSQYTTDIINTAYTAGGVTWPDPVDGNAFLYLGGSLGAARVSQVVQLEAGHNYELSFWLSDFASSSANGALVTTDLTFGLGTSVFSGAQTYMHHYNPNWVQHVLSFTAASTDNYTLTFASDQFFSANLDDVRITDLSAPTSVPEATSTAGLLAGALALAAGLRRRFVR